MSKQEKAKQEFKNQVNVVVGDSWNLVITDDIKKQVPAQNYGTPNAVKMACNASNIEFFDIFFTNEVWVL